jgi:plasmid maintenance system killer protein
MAKERNVNPATAALKASKKKEIKKSKANVATQRAEKFARRNPNRLQRQIDDLKSAEAAGTLRPKDKQTLEQLEKDLKTVYKARELLGDKAPQFSQWKDDRRGSEDGAVLGKRRRDEREGRRRRDSSSETDEDAKDVPMPKDVENMPPLPRRRPATNANETPLGPGRAGAFELPTKPAAPVQIVYEAAPVIRDLRKEVVSRFIPSSVAQNIKRAKGEAGLLEPEEAERLEKLGYRDAGMAVDEAAKEAEHKLMAQEAEVESSENLDEEAERILRQVEMDMPGYGDAEKAAEEAMKEAEFNMMAEEAQKGAPANLQDEGQRAERHLRHVEIEEVEDEDL